MARLVQRNSKPVKRIKVSDIKIGDTISFGDIEITVFQIDVTKNGYCFVDKYADDYKVGKNETVEIVEKENNKIVEDNSWVK